MKKLLCLFGICMLIPCTSLAQGTADFENTVSFADIEAAAVLSDADDAKSENTDGVTALVACFYDYAENTVSRLSDVINTECLMEGIYRIAFKSADAAESAYVQLKSHPNVKTVDYDRELKFDLGDPYVDESTAEISASPADGEEAGYPYNDYKLYGSGNWYLDDIKAIDAWTAMKDYEDISGNSAVVAVIDSGIDTANPDLKNRILTDSNGNMIGYNFVNSASASFEDDLSAKNNYHGTRVSSTIAAEANNGVGICGVAGEFDVKILPIKVFNSTGGGATPSVLIKAVNKAIEHNVDVINMSLSSSLPLDCIIDSKIETMQEAVNRAVAAGCVVVAAAGNNFSNQPLYPASYDNVISVSSYDAMREKADFSQYNDYIDVAAPGRGMALLTHSIGGSITSSTVNTASAGTSFSAPIVSAAAALLRIANPDITPTEISNIIKNTADDLGKEGYDIFYGFGAVNLEKAIKSAYDGFVEIKSLEYTKSLNVNVGEAAQIETVIMPRNAQNKIIKFESTNTSVATVSNNGVVLGVSPGEADILISTDFNTEFSKDENGVNFYCHVFVKPNIVFDDKINLEIGDATIPSDTSGSEFAMYADGYIWQVKKDGENTVITQTKGVNKPYEFCEYLPDSAVYKYMLVRKIDHKIIFAKDAALTGAQSFTDNDESNPTYTSVAHNGKDLTVLSSSGKILHFTTPASESEDISSPNITTVLIGESKIYMDDIVYIPNEKCQYYAMTGHDSTGAQYMYLSELKYSSEDEPTFVYVDVSLENGEIYKKLLVEGQYLYVLTNKAVYTIKTGKSGTNLATSGALKKYADIDQKNIKDIHMITVGNERVLVGYGANNNLYVITSSGDCFPIKTYDGTAMNIIDFNGGLYSVAGGKIRSEQITYESPENKSLVSPLCTYRVNILDKNKRLVTDFPTDGKFTVEYYAESIDRIIFDNGKYDTTSPAQNRLPVSVVFAVYNKNTGKLADIRVNNFMLDYVYLSEQPELSFGSLLRCEETFNIGEGEYYAKVMTFKGNNFYWPERNNSTTTLDIFTKSLDS